MWFNTGSKTKVLEFKKGSSWGAKLIPSSATVSNLTDNAINLHCKIWIDGELKHNVTDGGITPKRKCMHLDDEAKATQRKNELATDLGRILNESVMSDLKISTTNTCFLAHKAVLAGKYFV